MRVITPHFFPLLLRRARNIICVRGARYVASVKKHTLYDVLDVSYSATQAEIKATYYEMSLKYHPDKNSSQEAQRLFTEIAKAYSVLGNLTSRREYDKEIGTYYMMRSSPKKGSGEKVLRLTDEMFQIDMKGIKESGVFLSTIATLSTIMATPVRLVNVSLSNGGLQSNDMRVLQLLRQMSNGTLAANTGLTSVTFIPGDLLSGNFSAEAGRLGQLSLLLAAALPCLPFTPIPQYTKCNRLQLKGSTHSCKEIHADYIQTVMKPFVSNFGFDFDYDIRKRSYYPLWNGKVCVESLPVYDLKPINITECGVLTKITGWSFVGGAKPMRIAQMMAKNVHSILKHQLPSVPVEVNTRRDLDSRCEGTGQGVILVGEMSSGLTLTGTALWKKGMTPEDVASKAVRMLLYHVHSGSCIDELLQEQAILFMSLANGKSTLRMSPLTRGAKAVVKAVEAFTEVKFEVSPATTSQELRLKNVVVECEGQGIVNEDVAMVDKEHEKMEVEASGLI